MSESHAKRATRVFVSYDRRDRQFAAALSEALRAQGADVFDPSSLIQVRPGDDWADELLDELRNSDFLVFVVPRFEGDGINALAELGAARALGKTIVPVVPEPAWYASGSIASVVSRQATLDASRLSRDELARAILARGALEQVA
jgi:hypothetical protein